MNFTDLVQQLYIAYYGRPADPTGLTAWVDALTKVNGDTSKIIASFANSEESKALYNGTDTVTFVNQIYKNVLGRDADVGGLTGYAKLIDTGALTRSELALVILKNVSGTDVQLAANKLAAAKAFTAAIDTTAEVLKYTGNTAAQQGRDFLKAVTGDAATVPDAAKAQAAVEKLTGATTGKTFTLTVSVDSLTGTTGDDTFVSTTSTDGNNNEGLTAFDNIDGGEGKDTLTITSTAPSSITLPTTATVKNIETATVTVAKGVTADVSGWTGLTSITANTNDGEANVTAATTTNVTVVAKAAGNITVKGAANVDVTATGTTAKDITVSNVKGGDVKIASTSTAAADASMGTISVTGGKTVSVEQKASNSVNTTVTQGTVSVTGTDETTKVVVSNAAVATKSASVAGVIANTVSITDVNGGTDKAGTITDVTVSNYTTLSISGNAVNKLSLTKGSSNVIIDNSGLTTPTNKTLAVTVNGVTGGVLDDADIYTKLDVTASGANSTLANVTFGAATDLTVAGDKVLTLTSAAGLTALKTVTVSGSAGITADLSGATVTAVDTSASTGSSKVTIDAAKATFTGGAGADTVTLSASAPTKAISLGAGDDSLDISAATASPTGKLDGGAGTDNLTTTAATAATASADSKFAGVVTNFEKLTLTGSTNQTIDLAVLGNFNHVTTSGGNGLTLNNMSSGGTLVLNGAGTAYTVANTAFTAGTNDVLNLSLTDGTNAGVAFASTGITAANVETINIAVADTQATPSGAFLNTVTLLGNSAKTVAVTGNAGLNLTAASTALTSVDASGISKGGFTFTSGALAGDAVIKGSATGANTVVASAATKTVTYTGGTGADTVTISNGKNNVVTLGDGANSFTGTAGNNTVTGGKDADTVTLTTGNNTVSLGDGANAFTATTGNNTYTGGKDVDTVTVGGGVNKLTLGAGDDVVSFTAVAANVNSYSTITDAAKGDKIIVGDMGTETFTTAKVTLEATAVFQDYANAVVQAAGNASVNGAFGWFQWSGDTYLVQSRHDGSAANASFVNGTDFIVKLTGLIDLSTATLSGNELTLA